jgi:hypothetical protein
MEEFSTVERRCNRSDLIDLVFVSDIWKIGVLNNGNVSGV